MSVWDKNTPITPSTIKKASDEQILSILESEQNNPYFANLVRDELSLRFLERLGNLVEKHIGATKEVTTAVDKLDDSSDRLETLTAKLNRLTWVLIVLTALAVIVPVGIEVWHAMREINAPVPPIVIQYRLPTAPQTPPYPAR